MVKREFYFAYGSNMLSRRLRERVPSAIAHGVAFLPRNLLRWHKPSRDGSGKCSIEATGLESDRVYGVLFSLQKNQKALLAEFEGVGYLEEQVEVVSREGGQLALTYRAAAPNPTLKPYNWYK